ncbi:hypothetical protein IWX49DRAFT_250841 [Phyllosticta citricarpa]|uniref:Secreted protein n=1 Tax=Phyllosticta citricarpa TaxID=55181 RepID=A0ABR1MJ37_9PEZI
MCHSRLHRPIFFSLAVAPSDAIRGPKLGCCMNARQSHPRLPTPGFKITRDVSRLLDGLTIEHETMSSPRIYHGFEDCRVFLRHFNG